MSPIVYQVAHEYKAKLENLYGNKLAELILFGSHAREITGKSRILILP